MPLSEAMVREALDVAGLETLDVLGQDEEAGLHRPLRELDHIKALYIARKRDPNMKKGRRSDPS